MGPTYEPKLNEEVVFRFGEYALVSGIIRGAYQDLQGNRIFVIIDPITSVVYCKPASAFQKPGKQMLPLVSEGRGGM